MYSTVAAYTSYILKEFFWGVPIHNKISKVQMTKVDTYFNYILLLQNNYVEISPVSEKLKLGTLLYLINLLFFFFY